MLCVFECPSETGETHAAGGLEFDEHKSLAQSAESACDCPAAVSSVYTIQERESIGLPAALTAMPFVQAPHRAPMPRSNLSEEEAEHSPPEIFSAPHYLRLRTIRI